MEITPVISVVMPCHNAERHIARSIASALAQSFKDIELIIVNDGSTDNSLSVMESIRDPRLRIISQPNQGVSAARNRGLEAARGAYIAFLDADDTWEPLCLERLYHAVASRPDAVLAYCGWQNVGLPGSRGKPFIPPDYETANKIETLFAGCRWPIHAALTRRKAIEAAHGFNPSLRNAEDYALWLEVARSGAVVRVPEVLAYYHFHDCGQASGNRARAALQMLSAQQAYLERHPDFSASLAPMRRRELLYGTLLRYGYNSYWKRDLTTARTIFRRVMRSGYGSAKDWIYMLPALLPLTVHQKLIQLADHMHNSKLPPLGPTDQP